MNTKPEVWQRGPIEGLTPLLQPVAHALLQVAEELDEKLAGFNDDLLWLRPGDVASVGFHLQHMSGVIDRLFTYARSEPLTAAQLNYLSTEGRNNDETTQILINAFKLRVDQALLQLRNTSSHTLTDARTIGRKQLPTTVIGLLFHAAEHCQRHLGQLLVTARVAASASTI